MHKCVLPWISIETTPLGNIRPCCLYTEEIPNMDLATATLEDAFNSKAMRDLRRSFRRNEKPSGCERCWIEEDAGKKSKRLYMLDKFKDENVDYSNNNGTELKFLDLKLGNICNLKCRICGSWSSSKWTQEEIHYEEERGNTDHVYKDWLKRGQWPRKSNKFWSNLDKLLPQIKYFEFTGGEPWMIKQHFDLLQRAVDKGFAKDIDIHYNTNTTQFPKDPTIWKHFKHVQIAFSVDNTEERFEYERYGAKWKTSNANIKKVHALREQGYPITTQLCCTWNIQNIFYLNEVLTWANTMDFNSIHFNIMHDPWEFSLSKTPIHARGPIMLYLQKQQILHSKYKNDIIALKKLVEKANMNEEPEEPETGESLHKKLRQTDLYRNQNFALSHTKIAQAIKYEL